MKINVPVTVTDGEESLAGTVDGFELCEGGYVLHVFVSDHTDGSTDA